MTFPEARAQMAARGQKATEEGACVARPRVACSGTRPVSRQIMVSYWA